MELKNFDDEYGKYVIGIDEAGRGPLAGPVVAASVHIKKFSEYLLGINDSKKLTDKKRRELYNMIINDENIIYGIGVVDNEIIDEVNILNATFMAMKESTKFMEYENLDYIFLVDGNRLIPDFNVNQECVIKGDAKSLSIATASIIAKVIRDNIMLSLDEKYPEYMLAKHKGYGTKLHFEKIKENGLSPIHRKSFLKGYLEKYE